MLLQSEERIEIFQVRKGRKHPSHNVFGSVLCPFCARELHGHGWRTRYYCNEQGETLLIHIHRKLCPECRVSFTILPKGVHPWKIHSTATIKNVIEERITGGSFPAQSYKYVSRSLKGSWWRSFLIRCRIEKSAMTYEEHHSFLAMNCDHAAAHAKLRILRKPGKEGLDPGLREYPTMVTNYISLRASPSMALQGV